jgi:hypothetical protein
MIYRLFKYAAIGAGSAVALGALCGGAWKFASVLTYRELDASLERAISAEPPPELPVQPAANPELEAKAPVIGASLGDGPG